MRNTRENKEVQTSILAFTDAGQVILTGTLNVRGSCGIVGTMEDDFPVEYGEKFDITSSKSG